MINLKRRPIVVAALQSPFLLNRWGQSSKWRLFYELLGDHEGLEESKELAVKQFKDAGIDKSKVSAVLVTSPLQMENAKKQFPKAFIFWVVHTGFFLEVLPSEHVSKIDGIITLSQRVMDIQFVHKPILHSLHNFVIAPFYEVNKIWKWKKGVLWTIRSRPATRMEAEKTPFEYTLRFLRGKRAKNNLKILFFGQDAPDGYIDARTKIKMYKGSAAYIGALPVDAGFGLAEHEALAAGVPVVSMKWGDMPREMSENYTAFVDDIKDLPYQALRLAEDRDYAERLSNLGIQYIREHRSKAAMERQIAIFCKFISKYPNK